MQMAELIDILKDVQLSVVKLPDFLDKTQEPAKGIITVNAFIIKQKVGYLLEELTKPDAGVV